LLPSRKKSAHLPVTAVLQSAEEIIRLNRSEREHRDVAIGNDDQISPSCQPRDDRHASSPAPIGERAIEKAYCPTASVNWPWRS
jgi:hypothetical protein